MNGNVVLKSHSALKSCNKYRWIKKKKSNQPTAAKPLLCTLLCKWSLQQGLGNKVTQTLDAVNHWQEPDYASRQKGGVYCRHERTVTSVVVQGPPELLELESSLCPHTSALLHSVRQLLAVRPASSKWLGSDGSQGHIFSFTIRPAEGDALQPQVSNSQRRTVNWSSEGDIPELNDEGL